MARCEVCGNDYESSMEIRFKNSPNNQHTFDCFECAIQALAPECVECGVKVIGHGVQFKDQIFCCAHCARKHGVTSIVDHSPSPPPTV